MSIYGIGTAPHSPDEDRFPEMVTHGVITIGWPQSEAPGIHQLFRQIGVGDIVFAKSFPPKQGLFIKGVGIVRSEQPFSFPLLGNSAHQVQWLWHTCDGRANEYMGRLDDRYDYFRSGTLYQELGPRVQQRVIDILTAGRDYMTAAA